MSTPPLGRLEKVDLRTIWESEATGFTPWLAEAENLAILGDTLGIELELEAQEKNVGPFRADILCKDAATDHWVLIENQLERTDHSHLGQLMTYAAGLQAVTIIWLAAQFTEEHRATLDWLNKITEGDFRFFGVEVELLKIGDSLAAPRFNIVSKPNDWTKSVSRAARQIDEEAVTETKAQQLRYWNALNDAIAEAGSGLRPHRPRPQHWSNFSIGRSGFHLSASVNTVNNRLRAELYITGDYAKGFFHALLEDKDTIEAQVGAPLSWEELPDRIASRIALYKNDVDPLVEADWPNQHAWFVDALGRLDKALRHRIRTLQPIEPPYAEEAIA
jgi:hypothetical protein